MIVNTGKRFKKNNVYIFRRYKNRSLTKYATYMACLFVNKEYACLVPIHGKGEECEEDCYTLDLKNPEVLVNNIPSHTSIEIEIYGYFGEGAYWSWKSV